PLAPGAGVEPPLTPAEERTVEDDARRDPGAAVGRELTLRKLRQRLVPGSVPGARDPSRQDVDRVRLTAPPLGRPRVDEQKAGICEPAGELDRADRVAGALPRHELCGLDTLLARAKGAAPRREPADEDAAVLVTEVAQEPPEPLCTTHRPVRGDEHAGPDASPRRGPSEPLGRRQRMAPCI